MLQVKKPDRLHLNVYLKGPEQVEIIARLRFYLDRDYKKLSAFLIDAARTYIREQELRQQDLRKMMVKKMLDKKKDQKESQFSDPEQEVVWCEWCLRYIEPVIIKDEVYCPYCKLVL